MEAPKVHLEKRLDDVVRCIRTYNKQHTYGDDTSVEIHKESSERAIRVTAHMTATTATYAFMRDLAERHFCKELCVSHPKRPYSPDDNFDDDNNTASRRHWMVLTLRLETEELVPQPKKRRHR